MAQARLMQIKNHVQHNTDINGARQEHPVAGQIPKETYQIVEMPLGSTRHLRIVGIGAGASGINILRTLRNRLTDYEVVLYEKNAGIGGTWLENRYPGCKCDIPSHNYQFSWAPNPAWRSFFSGSEEINAYLERCCESEGLSGNIKLKHTVNKAVWDPHAGVWRLTIRDVDNNCQLEDYAHFLLDASGILNAWNWPEIPGLKSFRGDLVHSADWPESFQHRDKTVAVIGNGSSGVQIVPTLQPDVKRLIHLVRSPTWVAPSRLQTLANSDAAFFMEETELDDDGNFTDGQIEKFKTRPDVYKKFVKAIERQTNGNFLVYTLNDSESQATVRGALTAYMRMQLNDDARLCKAMIPDFPVGCRRLTPGVGYLEALSAPNVQVVTDSIQKVVKNGLLMSAGDLIEVDAIVCATGFDVSFVPRFPMIGQRGNLQDIWRQNLPAAYMSCAVPSMPNYFIFLGPNAPIGHGSVFTITEQIANYVVGVIEKCQKQGIKSIVPTQSAVDDFSEHIAAFMPRTTWAGSCSSWFKGGAVDGPVTALHAGSRIHFFDMLSSFRGEDFEYTYHCATGNRFAYLGNGVSTRELDGSDTTWYLDNADA